MKPKTKSDPPPSPYPRETSSVNACLCQFDPSARRQKPATTSTLPNKLALGWFPNVLRSLSRRAWLGPPTSPPFRGHSLHFDGSAVVDDQEACGTPAPTQPRERRFESGCRVGRTCPRSLLPPDPVRTILLRRAAPLASCPSRCTPPQMPSAPSHNDLTMAPTCWSTVLRG